MKKWRIICWTYVRSKCLVFTPKERSISALSKVSSSTYEIEKLLVLDQSQADKQKYPSSLYVTIVWTPAGLRFRALVTLSYGHNIRISVGSIVHSAVAQRDQLFSYGPTKW